MNALKNFPFRGMGIMIQGSVTGHFNKGLMSQKSIDGAFVIRLNTGIQYDVQYFPEPVFEKNLNLLLNQ